MYETGEKCVYIWGLSLTRSEVRANNSFPLSSLTRLTAISPSHDCLPLAAESTCALLSARVIRCLLVHPRRTGSAGLNPLSVIEAVGAGAAGSFSINQLGPRIAKRDFKRKFSRHADASAPKFVLCTSLALTAGFR